MFCPKCGTQLPDDSKFCTKCGAKLAAEEDMPGSASQPSDVPQKKKFRKMPVILGIVAILFVVIIALLAGGSMTEYEATVRAHSPFKNSQGLPYTYGEVFDKFIPDAVWSVQEADDSAIVTISGPAKGTNTEMSIDIMVTFSEEDPDSALISPKMVTVNGNKSPTEDTAVRFLFTIFRIYDEQYDDLSDFADLLDEVADITFQNEVKLTETFSDSQTGISFNYPAGWALMDSTSEYQLVEMIASHNSAVHTTKLGISIAIESDPFGVFTNNEESVIEAVSVYGEFLSLGDATISGVPAKVLKFYTESLNGENIVTDWFYKMNGQTFQILCSCPYVVAESYNSIFQAIVESYNMGSANISNKDDNQSYSSGNTANVPTSGDEAVLAFKHWEVEHPIGWPYNITAINDNDPDSFNLDLWIDAEEYGTVSVKKSDGTMTMIATWLSETPLDINEWYETHWRSEYEKFVNSYGAVAAEGYEESNDTSAGDAYKSAVHVSWANLMRYPEQYSGMTISAYGKVSQILNDGGAIIVNADGDSSQQYWIDVSNPMLWDGVQDYARVIVGDMVLIYGTFEGLQTVEYAINNVEHQVPYITATEGYLEDAVE